MIFFKNELKRAVFSRNTLACFFLAIACLVIGCYELLLSQSPNKNVINMFMAAYSSGTSSVMSLTFPLIACLPFAASYTTDLNTGFFNYINARMNIYAYISIRIIVNGLISGLVLMSSFIVVSIFLLLINNFNINLGDSLRDITLFQDLYFQSPLAYISLIILNSFIIGFVISTFGLGLSTVIKNYYISIVAPFLFYILSGTVFSNINKFFNMAIIYDLNYYSDLTIFSVLAYDSILLITGILLFLFGVKYNEEKFV